MKKRFLLLPSLLLVAGGLAWLGLQYFITHSDYKAPPSPKEMARTFARMHPDAETEPAVQPEPPLPASRKVRLAVGGLGLPEETQNGQVADLLAADLSSAAGLELVDRQSLDKVLRELELNLSGLVRAKDAVRVGKLLRADWFLLGSTTSAGASSTVIARIVDARSGVIRDIGVFPGDTTSPELATQLARFVRQYRLPAAHARPRVFLALGSFQDVSVNSRQADFPVQLRAQLLEAYRGSAVTLLEREQVSALLQEVHLDLAGLTDNADTSTLPTLQSAFWLVDGYYQSYETSDFQVELGLTVHRIFGSSSSFVLREKPGPVLVSKVKASIDQALAAPQTTLVPTRTSEARAQMEAGRQLLFPNPGVPAGDMALVFAYQFDTPGPRARRNLEEAAQAFQTVLLLEPTNRAAKVFLATALRTAPLYRLDEARQYYRQVLAEPVQDRWAHVAQDALFESLRFASPEEKLRWLQPVSSDAANPANVALQREASRLARDLAIAQGEPAQAQSLAESRLMERVAEFDAGRFYQESIGMDDFADTFGQDHAAAARRLVELYPKMKAQAPGSALYLLASVVSFQVSTNAPIIAQFEQALNEWADHPDKTSKRIVTFANHLGVVSRWAREHQFVRLVDEIRKAQQRASGLKPQATTAELLAAARSAGPVSGDEQAMGLAFSYKAAHRWREALEVFESYTNQPVEMGNSGPWGEAFTIVFTSKEAAECRKQLGLPTQPDPREFELGKPVLCLPPLGNPEAALYMSKFGAFAATPDGLWLAYAGQLLQLDFTLKTNHAIALPVSPLTPVHCLCVTPASIWVGTGGEGLVEYDLATHQCQHLTERQGLLLNSVYSLQAAGDVLWLGYGQGGAGGLGKLDFQTRRVTSFTPSLISNSAKGPPPPRVPVTWLTPGSSGDIWFIAQNALGRYRSQTDQWEFAPLPQQATALTSTPDSLFVALGGYNRFSYYQPTELGVSTRSLQAEQWKAFPTVTGLPGKTITTLTVDGRYLWVGGMAYIAQLDPAQGKVLRFAYIPSMNVDRIQVAGGYLWAQFKWQLYRTPLPSLP